MKPNRMKSRSIAALALLVLTCAAPVAAQAPVPYPTKPVRLIVPWPAGGGTDIISRIIMQRMSESMGQPIVIDNRAGASGIIGSELVAKAAADGYTLLMGNTATNATNASVYRKLPYDPIVDFAPVSLAANSHYLMSINP